MAFGRERRARRAFVDGGAFACRVRACGPPPSGWRRLRPRWSRRLLAHWAGEALVVRRGPVLHRIVRLPARAAVSGVHHLSRSDARRCGSRSIAVRLRLADGALIEVTTGRAERIDLVGPYLAAAVNDLPRAPVRRPDAWPNSDV
ncbi:hypothetical protein AMIS_18060 [Actinoplanes missouriensis 431]|uniref:Uncharacterized protein n=1 Tax=Actinoplanes missouriensis (strain ATCC 14538 / DSM 43046 / CBS 188.64 / JCM 3121 / NBRC 102363 / NCIMB 12654 / NRRL B-3342 / UNCC 431) TaxID=512565 RepID=I0H1Y9_ACTM4|nr:hypothetical protein AMIS_18060 [Actinoplanes missouriensis 431]